jgi:glycosyltransferase involved in cell wall biosynthesis
VLGYAGEVAHHAPVVKFVVYHDLPRAGGAPTVLAEVVKHLPQHEWSLYTPATADGEDLIGLDALFASCITRPLPGGQGVIAQYRRMLTLSHSGKRLAREIDTGRPDAVLVFPSVLVQAPEILPHLRSPNVYYAPEPLRAAYDEKHTLRARLSPYTRSRRRQDHRNIHAAGTVMTHSHYTAARLREVYGIEARIVHLGVDADRLRPADATRRREVLSVGALHPVKGHEFVIDAVATLEGLRPTVTVIGDRGEDGPRLEARARRLGVDLEILRAIPFETVVQRYQRAAVVACAAHGEPFGLSPLEAMATATPVVAVDEGGYRETVRDGVDGLRTPRDVEAFAAALARVIDDPQLSARLGAAGRLAAETHWSWARTAEGVERLLIDSV